MNTKVNWKSTIYLDNDMDNLVSNIAFFGFDLDKVLAKGTSFTGTTPDDTSKPGWFFVFKEMMGETHFGLDEFTGGSSYPQPGDLSSWDNINREHMMNTAQSIKFLKTNINFNTLLEDYKWNYNAANFSAILLRKPAFICIHAKELLS